MIFASEAFSRKEMDAVISLDCAPKEGRMRSYFKEYQQA